MTDSSIEDKIKSLIKKKFNNIQCSTIKKEHSIMNDLGADSLDLVELIMTVEEEFDIEVDEKEIEKLVTVNDMIEYIKTKL